VGGWENDPSIELHGPGYSKIIIGEDCLSEWEQHLEVIAASIVENGGRSCVNASAVWTPGRADEISEALAVRLAQIQPKAADDDKAMLAPFVDGKVASRISQIIDQGLTEPGARDVTAIHRTTERLVQWNGCSYMLPTIIKCDEPDHVLANKEFLFPFAAVVDVDPNQIIEKLRPSLVVTAITRDPQLIQQLVNSPNVDRLNIGPVATNHVSWDQPHEGNLFEHLYARRAFQRAVSF
jgi:acyl-CoA reductase-like NAD-dependent aldehyde dehydrogenase